MSAPPMIAAAYRFVWDSPITLRISSAMETARPVHSATTIFIRTSNSTPKEASALLMDSPLSCMVSTSTTRSSVFTTEALNTWSSANSTSLLSPPVSAGRLCGKVRSKEILAAFFQATTCERPVETGDKILCVSAVRNDVVFHPCAELAVLSGPPGHLCSQICELRQETREARVDELGFYAERNSRNGETQPSSGSRASCFTHGGTRFDDRCRWTEIGGGTCNRHCRPHDAITERGGVSRGDQIFIHGVRRYAGPARWSSDSI